jgi:DNA processing protein
MTEDEAVALSLVADLSRVCLTERLRTRDPVLIEQARDLRDRARAIRLRAAGDGIGVLPWNDPRFPSALLAISDVPPVLWYRGVIDAFRRPAVAIIGSRSASASALTVAERLGADVAARGVAVVSGLARGVDSAAHRGALRTGCTIAVLGSGLDRMYPREHTSLARDIAANGLVISEFPPGTPPLKFHFPMRNRVISGLSRAVVIVEASEDSGSLITARCALEQGREVLAVPGSVLAGRNRGAHALIRDGAKIVECADDIVEELGWPAAALDTSKGTASDQPPTTSGDSLLELMRRGEPYDLDELAASAGVEGIRLLPRLLELELQGWIERVEGGRFMRPARTC